VTPPAPRAGRHGGATIRVRPVPLPIEVALRDAGVHPLLARLFAARGIRVPSELDPALAGLLPPAGLRGAEEAARLLADAIAARQRLLIVADYDCDGATACAVGVRALRAFGAEVDFVVPDRLKLGYGLTPELVDLVADRRPDILITVDNGIASVDGVARANALGIRTLITDHHLPGPSLPDAACIVNPNQPGCTFPSKSIAGVGVMFYVMLALRSELRARGAFAGGAEPNLGSLLDLVALGTVADVVRLDHNNRLLVRQGLQRMRAGRMQPGVRALFLAASRDPRRASAFDLGFALGPRLNAAGRLADMRLGIEALITDDAGRALGIARELDRLNRERRDIEASMVADATAALDTVDPGGRATIALVDPSWHPGVIGILAARLKDRWHRPAFAFAPAPNGELRGSGRSIPGLHLRDCLDAMSKVAPDLLARFGGHAAAAGVTIAAHDHERFCTLFEATARRMLDPADLERVVETDGPLEPGFVSHPVARMLDDEVWGQGFPPPRFADEFVVVQQRVVGEKHLRLRLRPQAAAPGVAFDAMLFDAGAPLPGRVRAVYRLAIDEYNGVESVRLLLEHWEPA
jgi:single-stranded-DNA-specific exonuclease